MSLPFFSARSLQSILPIVALWVICAQGCSTSLISSDGSPSSSFAGAPPAGLGVGLPPLVSPVTPPGVASGATMSADPTTPVVVPIPNPMVAANPVSGLGSTVGALGAVVGDLGASNGLLSPLSPVLSPLTTPLESLIQGLGSQVELLGVGLFAPQTLTSQQMQASPLAQLGAGLSGVVGGVTGVTRSLGDGLGVGVPVAGLLDGVGGGVNALGNALQATGVPLLSPLGGVVSGLGGVVGSLGGLLTGTPIPAVQSSSELTPASPGPQGVAPQVNPLGQLLGGVLRGVGGLVGGLLHGVGGLLTGGAGSPPSPPPSR